jgi:transposase
MLTSMAPRRTDPKVDALRAQAALNTRSEDVSDPLFREHDFFDPRDLIQVKYEMVRRVRAEGQSVTTATAAFGLSRPTFYEAQTALKRDGLAGLLPKKRGPRGAHKLGVEVLAFLQRAIHETPSLRAPTLVGRIEERFGIRVHPRSIERALRRGQEKKRL